MSWKVTFANGTPPEPAKTKVYFCVTAASLGDLEVEVNEAIRKGYRPIGSPVAQYGAWVQAMITEVSE